MHRLLRSEPVPQATWLPAPSDAGLYGVSKRLWDCAQRRPALHGGIAHLSRTGRTGRPGTKAPVEKRSSTFRLFVVPSGAIISRGNLRASTAIDCMTAHDSAPKGTCPDPIAGGAGYNTAGVLRIEFVPSPAGTHSPEAAAAEAAAMIAEIRSSDPPNWRWKK